MIFPCLVYFIMAKLGRISRPVKLCWCVQMPGNSSITGTRHPWGNIFIILFLVDLCSWDFITSLYFYSSRLLLLLLKQV